MVRFSLLLLLILTFLSGHTISKSIISRPLTWVHIISRVPNELRLRCQSADDDLGNRTLSTGAEFKWNFRLNFFETTLFFCHFYWGSKDKSFVTYDKNIDLKYCRETSDQYNCYWEARPDGFYVSGDQKSWKLLNKWTWLLVCFDYMICNARCRGKFHFMDQQFRWRISI